MLEAAIRGATQAVIDAEPRITDFDTILGDGDCGQTLKTAALGNIYTYIDNGSPQSSTYLSYSSFKIAIQEGLSTYNLKSAPETILGIADTIEHSVGGTSSAIYCIFMNAFAAGLLKTNKNAQVDQTAWIKSSRFALDTLMTYTKARVGDRTLMDTLCPFVDTLNETEDVNAALEAARKGSEKTKNLSAKLGRSSYLDNKDVLESGIPDAGAYGLAELLTGMVKTLQ